MHSSEESTFSRTFRRLRIAILLFVLATVAVSAWTSQRRISSWKSTLYVAVYPINADGSTASTKQIESLSQEELDSIGSYFDEQSQRYGLTTLYPVRVTLGPAIHSVPPDMPASKSMLDAIGWSLHMRYWAWRNTPKMSLKPDVRMYLLYVDPATHDSVPDSVGLAKGRIGLAYLFSARNMSGSNLVVTTHELLHTLGATDKYDLSTDQPIFPEGYAEPGLKPLLPQEKAEIMAGRIPVDKTHAETPARLQDTLIGPLTAQEIGWTKGPQTDTH